MSVAEMIVAGPRPGSSGYIPQRSSKDGHQAVMDGHAKYLQAVLDGNVYIGNNDSGTPVTTQAGSSATTPAWVLYNPVGSTKLGVLWRFGFACTTAPAAISVAFLATNLPTATAPATVTAANTINALTGNSATGALSCYAISTLATAPTSRFYMSVAHAASSLVPVYSDYILDGMIVVYPGVALSFQTTAVLHVLCYGIWEEVPFSMIT